MIIIKNKFVFFVLLCMFMSVGVVAAEKQKSKSSSAKKKGDANWTQSVDGRNIKFAAAAEESSSNQALSEVKKISANIQKLKSDVVNLNKDLRLMEEKLLFPSNTKYSIFLSLNSGQFFTLESVKLKLDGELVASHIYTKEQRTALTRGGIQKLYITNLNEGEHNITAFFTGLGPNGRPYKRATKLDFEKQSASGYLELAIIDDGATQEPLFEIKQW